MQGVFGRFVDLHLQTQRWKGGSWMGKEMSPHISGTNKCGYCTFIRLFWGQVFPYISCIHTAYIGEYLHFWYLKFLVKMRHDFFAGAVKYISRFWDNLAKRFGEIVKPGFPGSQPPLKKWWFSGSFRMMINPYLKISGS